MVRIKTKRLGVYRDKHHISGPSTLVALKNQSSFLIGTSDKGMELIEDSVTIYKGCLPENGYRFIKDIIFIKRINAYLVGFDDRILIKTIDSEHPQLFIFIKKAYRKLSNFFYSEKTNQLVFYSNTEILVFDPSRRKLLFVLQCSKDSDITDLSVFGPNHQQAISINQSGDVVLYSLSRSPSPILEKQRVPSSQGPVYYAYPHAEGCEKGKYVFLQLVTDSRDIYIHGYQIVSNRLKHCFFFINDWIRQELHTKLYSFYADDQYLYLAQLYYDVVLVVVMTGENPEASLCNSSKGLRLCGYTVERSWLKRPVKVERLGNKLYAIGSDGVFGRMEVSLRT